MANTSLSLDNLEPFQPLNALAELDISHNITENIDLTSSSLDLQDLLVFKAAFCKFSNISDLIKRLGASIVELDISGNFLANFDAETFKNLIKLTRINVSHTNLSHFDFQMLEHQPDLQILDLSYNGLQTINFSTILRYLVFLRLDGNNLNEIQIFRNHYFPTLNAMGISKNQFSCEYLKTFLRQIKIEWNHLELIEDPWQRNLNAKCHPNM